MGTATPDFTVAREAMVERQLKARGIIEPQVLDAFRAVPREAFVEPHYAHLAYADHPLPIDAGQTISQPYIVALMVQAAALETNDVVLEVGAGSGYAAAVISRIADRVIAVERLPVLVDAAKRRMRDLGYDNVTVVEGDGTRGWAELAPFDAILVAASGSHVPESLVAQLRSPGRLIMPIGGEGSVQKLVRIMKQTDDSVQRSDLGAVRFVPLIGEEGWR